MWDIYPDILRHLCSGTPVVLATITRSSGSTPQKPGSSALFSHGGLIAGTVGGGILEGKVQEIAGEALSSGMSGHFRFNLDNPPDEEGAVCGGEAMVLLDARPQRHLAALENMKRSLEQGNCGGLLTLIRNDNSMISIVRFWIDTGYPEPMPPSLPPQWVSQVRTLLGNAGSPGFHELSPVPGKEWKEQSAFLGIMFPLPRLVIAGAGHVGKAVAHLGKLLGFGVTVIDDREEYANPRNIPDADNFLIGHMPQAVAGLSITPDTYVVIVTRGHRHDSECLRACIGSSAAYIGMIGSRKKVATLRQVFLDEGWASPGQWDQVHTPIGLEIGSRTVQEIAVSIAAQLVLVRNRKIHAYA